MNSVMQVERFHSNAMIYQPPLFLLDSPWLLLPKPEEKGRCVFKVLGRFCPHSCGCLTYQGPVNAGAFREADWGRLFPPKTHTLTKADVYADTNTDAVFQRAPTHTKHRDTLVADLLIPWPLSFADRTEKKGDANKTCLKSNFHIEFDLYYI